MERLLDQSISTNELVQRCLGGDAKAWQMLVDRYARLVHSIPARHGLTADAVNDVGQEVFLALSQHLHQIDDPDRLPAWLMTTARRFSWRAMQKYRSEQIGAAFDISDDSTLDAKASAIDQPFVRRVPSVNELLDGWNRQEMLQKALERLPDRCRTLLTLLFLEPDEPSYDAISAETGIPKGSIGPTRNRCLQQLRVILEGLGIDDL